MAMAARDLVLALCRFLRRALCQAGEACGLGVALATGVAAMLLTSSSIRDPSIMIMIMTMTMTMIIYMNSPKTLDVWPALRLRTP